MPLIINYDWVTTDDAESTKVILHGDNVTDGEAWRNDTVDMQTLESLVETSLARIKILQQSGRDDREILTLLVQGLQRATTAAAAMRTWSK